LIEMLVGLSILALMLGLVLSSLGPWLSRGRAVEREAQFWREVEAAQLTVSELTQGAIDVNETLHATPDRVRFRALAPRLVAAPIDLELSIAAPNTLLLRAPDEPEAVLLSGGPPLRLRRIEARGVERNLVVEADLAGGWTPVLIAPFGANAPLACDFDYISRTCR
jgi:type II secretory pathway pseudopilin PulG